MNITKPTEHRILTEVNEDTRSDQVAFWKVMKLC